jgi:hypothetical protein
MYLAQGSDICMMQFVSHLSTTKNPSITFVSNMSDSSSPSVAYSQCLFVSIVLHFIAESSRTLNVQTPQTLPKDRSSKPTLDLFHVLICQLQYTYFVEFLIRVHFDGQIRWQLEQEPVQLFPSSFFDLTVSGARPVRPIETKKTNVPFKAATDDLNKQVFTF